jgi:alkylhydroperoxidase/carboxymuconolactone decarboxylase family protein YurZ
VEIYRSARRHGIEDEDILHAVEHALAVSGWMMATCCTSG